MKDLFLPVIFGKKNLVFLISLIVGGLVALYFEVLLNQYYKIFYDSLGARDFSMAYSGLIGLLFISFIVAVQINVDSLLSEQFDLKIRVQLSTIMYNLAKPTRKIVKLKYSDQRIAEDIEIFSSRFASIGITSVFQFIKTLIFFIILWDLSPRYLYDKFGIDGLLPLISVLYFAFPTYVSYRLGKTMIPLENIKRKAEARLRYLLIDNLQKDEPKEFDQFYKVLRHITKISNLLIKITFSSNSITNVVSNISFIVPVLLMLPSYFDNTSELGDLIKATGAFAVFQNSATYIHMNFKECVRCISALLRINSFYHEVSAAS